VAGVWGGGGGGGGGGAWTLSTGVDGRKSLELLTVVV